MIEQIKAAQTELGKQGAGLVWFSVNLFQCTEKEIEVQWSNERSEAWEEVSVFCKSVKLNFWQNEDFCFQCTEFTSLSGIISFKSWGYKYGRASESEMWEVTGWGLYSSYDWF